jgi:nucleoside transporter
MNPALRIKLSVMMFLQYAIWGIWAVSLALHLDALGISGFYSGLIIACGGIGSILSPFLVGELADRYFATEKVLAFCHLVGGVLLIAAGHATTFGPIFVLMLIYCSLYFPTVALTNAVTFRALGQEHASQFGPIRFWGSLGWPVAIWLTGLYLGARDVSFLKPLFDLVGTPSLRDNLRIPGTISIVLGLFCFFALPHTPPALRKEGAEAGTAKRSAFLESLGLLGNRSFAVLLIVSAVLGGFLYYYFQCEQVFLTFVGSTPTKAPSQMALGQIAELTAMLLVPIALARIGIKRTMLIGASAYAVLFGLNILGQPWALMVAANLLHGLCFALFFTVAMIFVDKAASGDIKASAQSLFVFVVYGLANIVGNLGAGAIRDALAAKDAPHPNWAMIWTIPFIGSVLCILAFALLFQERGIQKPAGVVEEIAA